MNKLTPNLKYEAYKNPGVEWLPNIPSDWKVLPAKRFHKVIKSLNSKKQCSDILSLTLRGVVNNDPDNPEGLVPKDYGSYQIFERDNLVFKLIDLENIKTSRVGLVHQRGVMSPAYIRLEIGNNFIPKYAYYYYYDLYLNAVFNNLGAGVRSTLGPTDLLQIPMLQPSVDEQTAIANFLDRKTLQIDQAIAIKEKQIALLKERKQILIQNAVTRGLDPNVPMKDSGVEWIGEIPAHWTIIKLKHLFKETNERTQTGRETLLSLRMEIGLVPHDEVSDKYISDANLVDYKMVFPGQLVMNRMRAAIGIFGIPTQKGLVSPDYAVFDISNEIDENFYLTLFKTTLMGSQFRLNSKGLGTGSSGFMRLYTENFGDIKVPFPSKNEQAQIVTHIRSESTKLDKAIGLQQTQIHKLKEYKSTLINSAVTGKIKVT